MAILINVLGATKEAAEKNARESLDRQYFDYEITEIVPKTDGTWTTWTVHFEQAGIAPRCACCGQYLRPGQKTANGTIRPLNNDEAWEKNPTQDDKTP